MKQYLVIAAVIVAVGFASGAIATTFDPEVNAREEAATFYPTRPNGERDYTKQAYEIKGDKIYPLRANGERDYTKPAYGTSNGQVYRLRPNGERDYTRGRR